MGGNNERVSVGARRWLLRDRALWLVAGPPAPIGWRWPRARGRLTPDASEVQPYRGADRRNVLESNVGLLAASSLRLLAVAVVVLPTMAAVAVVALAGPDLDVRPVSVVATTLASGAFVVCATLLMVRWRLIGDAASGCLASVAMLLGLVVGPSFADVLVGGGYALSAALRLFALVGVVAIVRVAVRGPDVRADLRPVRLVLVVLAATAVVAALVALSPVRTALLGDPNHVRIADGIQMVLAAGAALEALRGAHRRGRGLQGIAVALIATAATCAARAAIGATAPGTWFLTSPLLYLAGAAVLLGALVGELDVTLKSVVRHDVRGRRRWEAAESELAMLRRVHEGQEHDVNSTLSAVSGALLVLQHQRHELGAEQLDYLTTATREQIQWLRTLLVGSGRPAESYDVTGLLGAAVALRSGQPQQVVCVARPGLRAVGRSDRLAMVLNNLLANAAIHAPLAQVVVWAGPGTGAHEGTIEVVVSDDGPGIASADLSQPLQRGWRGRDTSGVPGSGLGLFQCRELVEAEDGEIELTLTDPTAPPAGRGLSVHVWLPAAAWDEPAGVLAASAPRP